MKLSKNKIPKSFKNEILKNKLNLLDSKTKTFRKKFGKWIV